MARNRKSLASFSTEFWELAAELSRNTRSHSYSRTILFSSIQKAQGFRARFYAFRRSLHNSPQQRARELALSLNEFSAARITRTFEAITDDHGHYGTQITSGASIILEHDANNIFADRYSDPPVRLDPTEREAEGKELQKQCIGGQAVTSLEDALSMFHKPQVNLELPDTANDAIKKFYGGNSK